MSEPDGTQASSYPSPGRKQSKQLIDKKFRQSQPNYHPFDYRESEHSVRASWHKQKETKPSLWQPFSQRRQRELNRENSRVYRLRYGSKSELQGQREEQLDRTRRGISAAPTSRKSYEPSIPIALKEGMVFREEALSQAASIRYGRT